jgi:hypothetical protein
MNEKMKAIIIFTRLIPEMGMKRKRNFGFWVYFVSAKEEFVARSTPKFMETMRTMRSFAYSEHSICPILVL